jgi:hypothetical protein
MPPAINAQSIATAIACGLNKIKSTIEAQPKSITKQFRVLLFPQRNGICQACLWKIIILDANVFYCNVSIPFM